MKIVKDMVTGPNGTALLRAFQGSCNEGIRLSDIDVLREPEGRAYWLILGYCRASEMVEKFGHPLINGVHERTFEGKRHEVRFPLSYESGFLDTDKFLAKLALLRD